MSTVRVFESMKSQFCCNSCRLITVKSNAERNSMPLRSGVLVDVLFR